MKKILIVDNFGLVSTIIKLQKMFESLGYQQDTILITQFISDNTKNYDLVVLSGGSLYWARNPLFDNLKSWLLETHQPVLGICLGYEILVTSYDNTEHYVRMSKVGEIHGNYYPIMYQGQEYSVFRAHKRILIESDFLLDHFDVLGMSELGIDVIKDKNKLHYGLSFHPELDMEGQATHGTEILEDIMNQIFN